MPKYDIVSIGDTTIDAFIELHEASVHCAVDHTNCQLCLSYADKVPYESLTMLPAGNSTNNAVGSARLGLKNAFVTSVGDDENGRKIIRELKAEGIDTQFIHINKGVGCNTCHGPVDRMPLMFNYASLQMEWCIECHRGPEKNLRPREQVFNMRYQQPTTALPVEVDGKSYTDQMELGKYLAHKYNLRTAMDITSCSTCHR
jgi:hypothetical protein